MMTVKNVFLFYINGFRNMRVGKILWKIIFFKLFIILVFLNLFIYDKTLKTQFQSDEEKSAFVYENLKGK